MKARPAAHRLTPPLMLLLGVALTIGCAKTESYEQQPNLRAIAAYYSQYQARNHGQAPASDVDFKKFIVAIGGEALAHKGISVDELFLSERDGKPFVVKYRGDRSWPLRDIVVYEQEGRDGTRHAATSVGGYEVIPDEEFRSGERAPVAANR